MQAWQLTKPEGIAGLELKTLPDEQLGPQQVRVELQAMSLNYRDLGILSGGYLRNAKCPVIPLSDAVGVVTELGEEAQKWNVGDRVCPIFVQSWLTGPPTEADLFTCLGGGVDGVLAESRVFDEQSLVAAPDYLTATQAACLPCAAVTAYHSLFISGKLQPDETVLLLGTGGVSLFGLQLAKASGAKVIITSSDDAKLEKAISWGADLGINYREYPEWQQQVRKLTDGRGVDHILEVGGPGTLERSLKAASIGGTIHLIGVLDNPQAKVGPMLSVFNLLKIHGIYVGSREMFEQLNLFLVQHQLTPIIDREFSFEEAPAAYQYLQTQQHLGKVVICR